MATWAFAYTPVSIPPSAPFPAGLIVHRPYLIARVVAASSGQSVNCFVWLDSGADQCVFPLSFTGPLGFDPLNMKMDLTGGVGASANITYYETITVEIPITNGPTLSFKTLAGFTAGMEAQGIGLLGQRGFFETFQVGFNYAVKTFITKSDRPVHT